MKTQNNKLFAISILSAAITLSACGGGGAGGGTGTGPATSSATADRWVLSGNSDSTISILRVDPVAGFANAVAFHDTDSNFGIIDMKYDESNARILALTSEEFRTLSFDADSNQIRTIDFRPSSGNSSHFVLNSSGTIAYVASGTSSNQFVDVYFIDATGRMDPRASETLNIDPDYITLNPAQDRLYVVSRSDNQIVIFDINSDGSLAANPTSINTGPNPTSLIFHPDGNVAYLTRSNKSQDGLQVMNIGSNGELAPSGAFFDVDTNPIDMVLSADASQLYVIEASSRRLYHYSVDSSGALTFMDRYNVNFNPSDLTLSRTGGELYISHNQNDVVSTWSVNAVDGSLIEQGFSRVFENANTVAAVGGAGALTPKATYLLAPDESGLSKFSIGSNGLLSLVNKESTSSALITGEIAVQYSAELLLGAGQTASPDRFDMLSSYTFDLLNGDINFVQQFDATASNAESQYVRIELGRSGETMYVLDRDLTQSNPAQFGFIRAYNYADDGSFTTAAFDTDGVGMAPENMTLHPAGRYLYSVNSFGDNINIFEVDETSGSLSGRGTVTPGGTGSGRGRPIDLKFHPNGRYAYVSLEDDSQVVSYQMNENGSLSNLSRTSIPQDNGQNVQPAPIAVHPNGRYIYVGERNGPNNISLFDVNQTNFSLTFRSRIATGDNPSWIEVDPSGQQLYVRVRNGSDGEIRVYDIDQSTGSLTDTGQQESVGNSGFLPSFTLVTPLQ